MLETVYFTDFILFLYIYIGTQWVGWSLEQTLSSRAGFALFMISAFLIFKRGIAKPFKLGRVIIAIGITLLLISYASSLQVRNHENLVLVEGDTVTKQNEIISLKKVIVKDSPGVIRNGVYATARFINKINSSDVKKEIGLMPPTSIDGYYWRILSFGYAPNLSLYVNDRPIIDNQYLVLRGENWTNKNETALAEAGLMRNPPPRMMLSVGSFPPEMETLVDLNNINLPNSKLFIRLTKATFKGRNVSLDGDNYWRYLVHGPLKNPELKVTLIKNKKALKAANLKIKGEIPFENISIKFNNLKYWVELEKRRDPFIPLIVVSFFITYLGIVVATIQFIAGILRKNRKNLSQSSLR